MVKNYDIVVKASILVGNRYLMKLKIHFIQQICFSVIRKKNQEIEESETQFDSKM